MRIISQTKTTAMVIVHETKNGVKTYYTRHLRLVGGGWTGWNLDEAHPKLIAYTL
jgi:hypothetical protein